MRARRTLIGFVAFLAALPDAAWACPSPRINHMPFAPYLGVHYSIDAGFDPGARDCMAQGLESWDSAEHGVQVDGGGATNLLVMRVDPQLIPGASDGPNAEFVRNSAQTDAAGFTTYGVIWVPNNIEQTAGYSAPGGCQRLRSLLAHELGHGMVGSHHSPGSIMQGANVTRPYWGLDDLPDGPTPCDRDAENWARVYNDDYPTKGGLDEGCGPNDYQDSHGCPCNLLFADLTYTGQNLKPMVHQQWPRTGLYAPFGGYLDLHTDDANGHVWRVDYFLNGQFFLTSTSPPFGFHFNVQPGTYTIQAAAYDNDDQYSMSALQTISVCGSPPYGANWVQYTKTPTGLGGYWVTLSWPAVPMANNYRVEASTTIGGPANLGTWVVGNVTSWVAGPVGPGSFWVRVRSGNPCGWGFASSDHSVIVP